jgi:hypothetical protein
MLGFAIAAAVTLLGYWQAKRFTRNRLRFVDAVQKPTSAALAGLGAAAIAWPVTWLLPIVGTGTALLFGAAVAVGVSAGARDIRRRIGGG